MSQLITLPWFITPNNKDCPKGGASQFFQMIIIQRLRRHVIIFQWVQRHQDYVISLVFFQQSFECCHWRKWRVSLSCSTITCPGWLHQTVRRDPWPQGVQFYCRLVAKTQIGLIFSFDKRLMIKNWFIFLYYHLFVWTISKQQEYFIFNFDN